MKLLKKVCILLLVTCFLFIHTVTIYANDKIATYRFYSENDTVISTQKIKKGDTLYSPATPEKEGHVFVGWSNSKNDNSHVIEAFVSKEITDDQNEDVNYYPIFNEKRYVYFMHPNGSVLYTKEGVKGDTITTKDVTFNVDLDENIEGWYLDKELTLKVDTYTMSDKNIKLYPKTTSGNFIIFNREKGATYYAPSFVKPNEVTKDPGTPTRKGYTFEGWSTIKGSKEANFTFGKTLDSTITLYAIWKPVETTYTVRINIESERNNKNTKVEDKKYDNAGLFGTFSATSESEIDSKTQGLSYSRAGFKRNTSKDKIYTVEGDGSTIVDIFFDRELITYSFYKVALDNEGEQFGENNYRDSASQLFKITYNENDDKWYKEDNTEYKGNRYTKGQNISGLYNTTVKSNGEEVPAVRDSTYYWEHGNTNYTSSLTYFTHLDIAENMLFTLKYCGKYVIYFKEIKNTAEVRKWVTHRELYSGEYDNTNGEGPFVSMSYVCDENSGRWLTAYSYDDETTKTQLDAKVGNKVVAPLKSGSVTHLYYTLRTFTLKYHNYNKTIHEDKIKYTTPVKSYTDKVIPDKPEGLPESYIFLGWYSDAKLNNLIDKQTMPARDVNVYAKWGEPTYKVKVHKDLNENGESETLEVGYLKTIDKTSLNDIKESKKWAIKHQDGTLELFNLETQIDKDYEIYPVNITSENSYKVTYDMDGGNKVVIDNERYIDYSAAIVLSGNNATKNGLSFLKWEADGVSYYPGSKIQMTKDMTLKAVYGLNPTPTSLTYNANGGVGEDYTLSQIVNNDTVAIATLAETKMYRNGYIFKGWSTSKDGSNDLYKPGDSITVNNKGKNILYAIWEKENTTITHKDKTIVKTGDNTNVIIYIASLVVALILLIVICFKQRRKH